MANIYLYSAAVLSATICGVHLYFGGRAAAQPLLRARDLHPVPKYTNYYCWHIVSIVLAAMPIGFALAAHRPESMELAVLMTGLASAFAVWSLVLVVWKKQKPLHLPQWALFIPVAVLGVLGLLQ